MSGAQALRAPYFESPVKRFHACGFSSLYPVDGAYPYRHSEGIACVPHTYPYSHREPLIQPKAEREREQTLPIAELCTASRRSLPLSLSQGTESLSRERVPIYRPSACREAAERKRERERGSSRGESERETERGGCAPGRGDT